MFDLEKINEQYFKLFIRTQNVTEEKENKFREFIKQHPRVIYDNEVLGGDDFEIGVQVESLKQLREFINEIKEKNSDIIRESKTMMFYKEYKFVFSRYKKPNSFLIIVPIVSALNKVIDFINVLSAPFVLILFSAISFNQCVMRFFNLVLEC